MKATSSKSVGLRWLAVIIAVVIGVALAAWWRNQNPPTEVPIQDGKTIDFSSGRAEVRDEAADRAAIEKAKREMDEATADITFAPTKPKETDATNP